MGKLVIKRPRPSLSAQKYFNYGRQSTMKSVYDDRSEATNAKKQKPVVLNTNKKEEKEDTVMMDTKQKIELANEILSEESQIKAKRIKKDKGLIERKENTIILTEDNRELLKD